MIWLPTESFTWWPRTIRENAIPDPSKVSRIQIRDSRLGIKVRCTTYNWFFPESCKNFSSASYHQDSTLEDTGTGFRSRDSLNLSNLMVHRFILSKPVLLPSLSHVALCLSRDWGFGVTIHGRFMNWNRIADVAYLMMRCTSHHIT